MEILVGSMMDAPGTWSAIPKIQGWIPAARMIL
jgi:hypothetical protein